MWLILSKYFGRYPSQGKVARLLLSHGLRVKEGKVYCDEIEVADMAIARAAQVDRRIVRAAVQTIEAEDELREVYSALHATAMLRDVAPVMGWSCIEVVPTDAHVPGILAEIASIIAEAGINIRQALVDDPMLMEEPRLYVITESAVPSELIPRIKKCRGVRSLILH
ncbi:MAG: regulator of amino acid metabolism, contains ACT domain protein [Euryarchaeota archaeon]|nr:regulator of amino acid metabolism, contains ACT domain protein [Euryarchaeota archaeon]